jgi:hypothetical protein
MGGEMNNKSLKAFSMNKGVHKGVASLSTHGQLNEGDIYGYGD